MKRVASFYIVFGIISGGCLSLGKTPFGLIVNMSIMSLAYLLLWISFHIRGKDSILEIDSVLDGLLIGLILTPAYGIILEGGDFDRWLFDLLFLAGIGAVLGSFGGWILQKKKY